MNAVVSLQNVSQSNTAVTEGLDINIFKINSNTFLSSFWRPATA